MDSVKNAFQKMLEGANGQGDKIWVADNGIKGELEVVTWDLATGEMSKFGLRF